MLLIPNITDASINEVSLSAMLSCLLRNSRAKGAGTSTPSCDDTGATSQLLSGDMAELSLHMKATAFED